MTTSDWIAIGGIAVPVVIAALGWAIGRFFRWKGRVDKKLAGVMMEDKHDDICSKRTAELQRSVDQLRTESRESLERIESLIERNHKESGESRHRLGNQVLMLTEKVGRIEGRLGVDEFARGGGR